MSHRLRTALWVVIPLCLGYLMPLTLSQGLAWGAGQARTNPAPKFDQATVDIFFANAIDKLGPGQPGAVRVAPVGSAGGAPVASEGGAAPAGGGQWSQIISAESLEGEIKGQFAALDEAVKNPVVFKGGGNTRARNSFTMLTLMFGIINGYDGEVRWKKDAASMQAACERAADNCKTSSDNAFKEARLRTDNLKDLIGGQTPSDLPKLDPDKPWSEMMNVPPLMQRLDLSQKDRLGPWTGSKAEMDKNADAVRIEGEVLAAIGKVLQMDGFDNADADDYVDWAKLLHNSGKDLAAAAKAGDHDKAKGAVSGIGKACTDCHSAYR